MRSPLCGSIFFLASVFLPGGAGGEEVDLRGTTWFQEVSPLPKAGSGPIRGAKLTYHLTWKRRIKAATAEILIAPAPGNPAIIHGMASGHSDGLAGRLFPYQFRTRSAIGSDSLLPLSFEMLEETRGNRRQHTVRFVENQVQTVKRTTSKKSSETTETKLNFQFEDNLVRDVFSLLLCSRSLPLANEEELTTVVNPVDRPYLVRFRVLGREERRLKGKSYQTIKLDVGVARINDDKTLKQFDKLKGATLWLIDDEERFPLEFKADLFVGHFSAYLDQMERLEGNRRE